MMAETIRCYIPPPLEIVAARRGGGSRETGEAHPRGIVRADAASAAVEAEDMVPMGGASGVVTGRCALVDARAPIAVDPTVAFFPRGAVRRTARRRKSAREKIQNRSVLARSFPTTPLERPFSSSHRPSIGPLRAVPTKPPPPDHENGGARSAWKKRTTTPRSGRRRTPRAHTSPRAARPTLTPSSSLSLSACVPSPRSCSRSSPAPREAAEPRATTAVERRVSSGGCVGCTVFSNRAAGRRARGRDGRALGS